MFVNERSIDIDEESLSEDATCEQMIEHYFKQGFVYDKILQFLSKYHGINISMQTLNTKLQEFGLRRRNQECNLDDIRRCTQLELDAPGSSGGYRSIVLFGTPCKSKVIKYPEKYFEK